MSHKTITFHPFRENILDYIDANLFTANGDAVNIKRAGHFDFIVEVNGREVFRHDDNYTVSYVLNDMEIRFNQEDKNGN